MIPFLEAQSDDATFLYVFGILFASDLFYVSPICILCILTCLLCNKWEWRIQSNLFFYLRSLRPYGQPDPSAHREGTVLTGSLLMGTLLTPRFAPAVLSSEGI